MIRQEACLSSSCMTLMSALFARRRVEYVCRKVCHPMCLVIPSRIAIGRMTLRMISCPHYGCRPFMELQAIADQTNDRAAFLRLVETLTAFLARLRSAAETLNVAERQRIVRLVVKDVLVGDDTITIRHSIPIPSGPPQNEGSQPEGTRFHRCSVTSI